MYDPRLSPADPGLPRGGGSLRRANFVAHMGLVGDDGTASLAEEGVDAHRVSAELQGVARGNTAGDARRFAHAHWRHTAITIALLGVFVVGFAWILDNVVGYSQRTQGTIITRVVDSGPASTVVLADGRRVTTDCFGAKPGLLVWKAAPPTSAFVPYRCGNEFIAAEFPGPMSLIAAGFALVSGAALLVLRARWRRKNAWY